MSDPFLNSNSKILFIRSAFIGDFLVTIPFIEGLQKEHRLKIKNFYFLTINNRGFDPAKEIFLDKIGGSCVLNTQNLILSLLKIRKTIRDQHIDLIIYLPFSPATLIGGLKKYALTFFMFPLIKKIGFFSKIPASVSQYEAPYFALKRYFPIPFEFHSNYNSKLFDSTDRIFNIALYVNSQLDMKIWPLENYIQLIMLLNNAVQCQFHLIGGHGDYEYNQNLIEHLDLPNIKNVAGNFSISGSIEFLDGMDLLIANDGSPVHMATLVNTPIVSLMTYKEPLGAWDPIGNNAVSIRANVDCKECYLRNCDNNVCLTSIPVDYVFEEGISLLKYQESDQPAKQVVLEIKEVL
jgi:ADP-heptose:LPS heptosyltransferase